MLDASTVVFISYSRVDSAFVDRLEADLQARAIPTWVDRKNLQGGQEWQDEIQQALEHSRVVLVVLTPEAVASRNARREYRYALSQGKPVIPVMLRSCPSVPMDLNDIQWVSFVDDYGKGLQDLLIALASLPAHPATLLPASVDVADVIDVTDDRPVNLVTARPAPRVQVVDLNALYRQGVKARADGDLEGAALAWQQVLDRDLSFGGGSLSSQLRALNQELRPVRLQRLRQRADEAARADEWGQVVGTWRAYLGIEPFDAAAQQALQAALRSQAEQAHKLGHWKEEIGAWDALQQLVSHDPQVQERIPIAMKNQECAWHYETAQQFLKDGDTAAARAELETLWQAAPYYGDPEGLAPAVGLSAPPDYETAKADRLKREAEEREATHQMELKRAEHELELQKRVVRRQRYGLISTMVAVLLLLGLGTSLLKSLGDVNAANQQLKASLPVNVTSLSDDNSNGTLRWALSHAADGNAITFSKNLHGTITLTQGQLVINKNVIISGPGISQLAISGGGVSRVFEIAGNSFVTISNLTITGGNGTASNGSSDAEDGNGGGILNDNTSTLTLINDSITNNKATLGGGIYNLLNLHLIDCSVTNNHADKDGGGIFTDGSDSAIRSTIALNTATGNGGGIASVQVPQGGNQPFTDDTNSTITGNRADSNGGGIYANGSTVRLDFVTVDKNTAGSEGGGVFFAGQSAALGSSYISASIVSGDTSHSNGPDILGPLEPICANLVQNAQGLVAPRGVGVAPLSGDPQLGPLQNNGGPTQTQALSPNSRAIGAIPSSDTSCGDQTTDQRGFSRPQSNGYDLGAYQYVPQ